MVVNLKKVKPAVLATDASFNIFDVLARADATLNDMVTHFGLALEVVSAVAARTGKTREEVLRTMNTAMESRGMSPLKNPASPFRLSNSKEAPNEAKLQPES